MHSSGKDCRLAEFSNMKRTLVKRLADYLDKIYTYNTAKLVSRDVRVATGIFIPPSTITKWLYLENGPSPEREVLLDITYDGLTEYLREPFKIAHNNRKEQELENIIKDAEERIRDTERRLEEIRGS